MILLFSLFALTQATIVTTVDDSITTAATTTDVVVGNKPNGCANPVQVLNEFNTLNTCQSPLINSTCTVFNWNYPLSGSGECVLRLAPAVQCYRVRLGALGVSASYDNFGNLRLAINSTLPYAETSLFVDGPVANVYAKYSGQNTYLTYVSVQILAMSCNLLPAGVPPQPQPKPMPPRPQCVDVTSYAPISPTTVCQLAVPKQVSPCYKGFWEAPAINGQNECELVFMNPGASACFKLSMWAPFDTTTTGLYYSRSGELTAIVTDQVDWTQRSVIVYGPFMSLQFEFQGSASASDVSFNMTVADVPCSSVPTNVPTQPSNVPTQTPQTTYATTYNPWTTTAPWQTTATSPTSPPWWQTPTTTAAWQTTATSPPTSPPWWQTPGSRATTRAWQTSPSYGASKTARPTTTAARITTDYADRTRTNPWWILRSSSTVARRTTDTEYTGPSDYTEPDADSRSDDYDDDDAWIWITVSSIGGALILMVLVCLVIVCVVRRRRRNATPAFLIRPPAGAPPTQRIVIV